MLISTDPDKQKRLHFVHTVSFPYITSSTFSSFQDISSYPRFQILKCINIWDRTRRETEQLYIMSVTMRMSWAVCLGLWIFILNGQDGHLPEQVGFPILSKFPALLEPWVQGTNISLYRGGLCDCPPSCALYPPNKIETEWNVTWEPTDSGLTAKTPLK